VVLGHPLSRVQLAAIAMALAGSALTIGRAPDGTALGVLFGLLAALIYSVYILVGSRLPAGGSASASSAVVISAAAAVYAVVGAARGLHLPQTAAGWLSIVAIAVLGTAVAIGAFLGGLDRLGPVRASVYSTLEPVFTLLLAALFLGESVGPLRAVGGALILSAVVILARADAARTPAPA
jgi:drug/metabolite transporter (DMT)-like permease